MIKRKIKPKLSLSDLRPKDFGKGTEKLSEEIDEILYSIERHKQIDKRMKKGIGVKKFNRKNAARYIQNL